LKTESITATAWQPETVIASWYTTWQLDRN